VRPKTFSIFQLIIMALLMMTIYLRTEMHRNTAIDGEIYMGALFFSLSMIMFNGFSELALTILKLPVFYKQRDLLFYPSWSYSLPTWIVKIPITFIEVAIWVSMTYYVVGFDPNIKRYVNKQNIMFKLHIFLINFLNGRFFRQYLLLVCISQMASALFRFIAALGRDMTVANTFGSFGLLLVIVLGGFILSRGNF
jgi:hypothetical protein